MFKLLLCISNQIIFFIHLFNDFSLEYHKELIMFNSSPIYSILAKHLKCNKEKLVEQVNQLVDFEEVKIIEPIER